MKQRIFLMMLSGAGLFLITACSSPDEGAVSSFFPDPRWTGRMAEQGDPDAQYLVGAWCVDRDREKAVFWLEKSAAQGNEQARKLLNSLKKGNNADVRNQ